MEESRTKHAKRNILSGIIYKAISIGFPFLVRSIIILKLGMDYLGLDSLFVSILQVLNMGELGFSSAIVFCMYKPIAIHDNKRIGELYNFFRKAYKVIGCIILFAGILITPFLKLFIKGDIPDGINIYVLYFVYLFNTFISYFLFAYKNALLTAFQRVDVNNNFLSISKCILYLWQFFAILIWENYYIYVIGLPVSTIIYNKITSIYVDKKFIQIKAKGKINGEDKNIITRQIKGIFVNKLCQISRNSFDSIVISSFVGLSITGIYNNYFYIMNAVLSILAIITNSIISSIGNKMVTGSEEANYKDFIKFNFIYVWIGGWFSICLLCLYQPFMNIWAGEDNLLPDSSMILFVIYFYFLIIGNMRATYSEAAGLWWQNRHRAIAEALINLFLNVLLGYWFGVNGVLISTVLTVLIVNYGASSFVLYKYYFVSFEVKDFFLKTLKYLLVTILSGICCLSISRIIHVGGIIQLIILLFICSIITNCIYFVVYKRSKEFSLAYMWLKEIIKK